MEERLDAWMTNFRGEDEKLLALKIFMRMDYYNELLIDKIILQYRKIVEQYLVEEALILKMLSLSFRMVPQTALISTLTNW